ncbi:hypothetical protein I2492_06100 [Budviciaceae bacterium CWB-B4]|uniref:Uncharacterized protein n=1 Tax=Limnobaculum xujianqingii TaxID=2738837 RepID=A0A9D7AH49_9GAMM|nr:hypothetical protein [Limnobaculum xujianqingii]MBK5072581.1 hypothetical protein [Limnobaculum xujianqingii]MBK5175890.1 hypothetical protein [Limnobaculum xujianqingii]
MKITMQHIRAGGGCAWGLRAFFDRYHLDLDAFLAHGFIDSELLEATENELALNIVRKAQETEQDKK